MKITTKEDRLPVGDRLTGAYRTGRKSSEYNSDQDKYYFHDKIIGLTAPTASTEGLEAEPGQTGISLLPDWYGSTGFGRVFNIKIHMYDSSTSSWVEFAHFNDQDANFVQSTMIIPWLDNYTKLYI